VLGINAISNYETPPLSKFGYPKDVKAKKLEHPTEKSGNLARKFNSIWLNSLALSIDIFSSYNSQNSVFPPPPSFVT
jgi:hypothetical protein